MNFRDDKLCEFRVPIMLFSFIQLNSRFAWLNFNGFRVSVKVFLLIYGSLILSCLIIFRNYFGVQILDDEWNNNKSRLIQDYIFPDRITTLSFVRNPCANVKPPSLLIIVCSSLENYSMRDAIRETWASKAKRNNIAVLFLVGQSKNSRSNSQIFEENETFNDLIIENFVDSYQNLTIKSAMLLKWVKHNCQSVPYIMKIDDDVYLNVDNLSKFLMSSIPVKNLLIGKLYTKERPYRNEDAKWYVPESVFKPDKYPPYLCGVGYFMSTDVADKLYNESFKHEFLYIEDLFFTGICGENAKLERQDHLGFHFFEHFVTVECNSIHAHMILLSHQITSQQIYKIHHALEKCDV